MPVKNGIDMVRQIRTHRPGIKTVYISADLSRYQKSLKEEKLKYHAMTLQKPFSRFELIGAISKKTD
jgi:two-component SAPR family response regulator